MSDSEANPKKFQDEPTLLPACPNQLSDSVKATSLDHTVDFRPKAENAPQPSAQSSEQGGIVFEQPTFPPHDSSNSVKSQIAPSASLPASFTSKSFTAMQEKLPRQFGDYVLIEEIARGGMGVVYKAKQERLNRIVAVKMILSGQLAGKEDVLRFYAEAEAAANLNHPGVVPIYEVGQNDGQHFFSMGFVDGPSLATLITEHPIEPNEAAIIAVQTAEAIGFAHARGVIHRDLKPANVLLTRNEGSSTNSSGAQKCSRYGQPKVTDFGLAKQISSRSELTATGQILGTPGYMPPEQAAGKTDEIGERADVYSLGAVLYAMLTGTAPFQAATPIDTLIQVLEREPTPPRHINSKIPVDLETICLKCLQKDQKRRYQSASELIDDLNRFIDGSPILARPVTSTERLWRWSRKHPAVAVLSLFSAALMLVILIAAPIIAFRQAQLRMAESIAKNDAISVSEQLEVAKDEAEASHYSANISLAYSLWAQGSLTRARHLLNQSPQRFRNWEWWFLDRLCSGNAVPLRGNASQTPEVRFMENGRLLGLTNMATARQWDIETGIPCDSLKVSAVKCSFDRYARRMVSWTDDEAFSSDMPAALIKKSFYQPGMPIVFCVHALDSTEIAILRKSARKGESFSEDVLSLEIVNGLDGETVAIIENLPASVNPKAALSPTANQFAYIADGNTLIWGSKTSGWSTQTFELNNYKATQVGFSPATKQTDGCELLTVACSDGVIRIFELDNLSGTLRMINQLETTGAEITALTWNENATLIGAGSNDRLVSVWRYGEMTSKSIFRGIEANVNSLSFSKDSRYIAAGAEFGIKAWKIGANNSDSSSVTRRGLSRQDTLSIPISVGPLTRIVASSDDRICCVVDESNRIYKIDTNTWKFSELPIRSWLRGKYTDAPYPPPPWNPGIPMQVELSPDGRTLAFTISVLVDAPSLDVPVRVKSSIVLWDLVSQIPTRVLGEHDNLVTCMSFTPDGKSLIAGTGLPSESRQIIKQLSRVGSRIEDRKNIIRVWDVLTGLADVDLSPRSENYSVMTFSNNGEELFCSGDFATIDVWNWEEKKLSRQIRTPAAITPSQIQFAELPARVDLRLGDSAMNKESEQHVAYATQKSSQESIAAQSSNLLLRQQLNTTKLSQNDSNSLDEKGRRSCIMTSGMDGRIRIYDSITGGLLRILEGHSNRATGVLPIDRGIRIASCSEDGTVRVWDPVFGTELLSLPHDGQMVRGLAWLPRSQTLLTVSNAGLLSVWQAGEDNLPEVDNWPDILGTDESTESLWSKVSGQWKVNGRNLHGITENVGAFQGVGELAVARIDLKDQILPDTAMLEFEVTLNNGTALQILINDKNSDGEVIELATSPNPFTQRVGISISKRGDQQNLRESVANPTILLVSGKTHKVRILRNPNSITVLIDDEAVLRATLPTTLDCTLALQGTFGSVGSVVTINNVSIRSSKPALERRNAWKTIVRWAEEEMLAERVLKRIEQNDSWSFELKRFARQRANGISLDPRRIFEKIDEWLRDKDKDLSKTELMIELCEFSIEHRSRWAEWFQLAYCQELASDYQSSLDLLRKSIELCLSRNGHAMPSQWGLVAICNFKLGRLEAAKRALIKANRSLSFVSDDGHWEGVSETLKDLFGKEASVNGLSDEQQGILDFVVKNNLDAQDLYADDFVCEIKRTGISQSYSAIVDRKDWIELGNIIGLPGTIGLEDCFVFDHEVSDLGPSPSVTLYVVRELKLASSAIYKPPRWQTMMIHYLLEGSAATWKIKKQLISPLGAKYSDVAYSFLDGTCESWDKLLNAKLSALDSFTERERILLAEQLVYAFRERDAISVLQSLEEHSSLNAEQQVLISLAALLVGDKSLAHLSAENAIQLNPSIKSPKFLERIASAKFGQSERVNIGKNLFADIPRSWKLMGSDSFIGASDMQIGWLIDPPQACVSVLYKVDRSTRDQFMAQIKIANETYNRTVLEERAFAIANTEVQWVEVEGQGNGGIIDGEGGVLTRQIFVMFFLEREVLMLTVVGPAESWTTLKAAFESVVGSITEGPKE